VGRLANRDFLQRSQDWVGFLRLRRRRLSSLS